MHVYVRQVNFTTKPCCNCKKGSFAYELLDKAVSWKEYPCTKSANAKNFAVKWALVVKWACLMYWPIMAIDQSKSMKLPTQQYNNIVWYQIKNFINITSNNYKSWFEWNPPFSKHLIDVTETLKSSLDRNTFVGTTTCTLSPDLRAKFSFKENSFQNWNLWNISK